MTANQKYCCNSNSYVWNTHAGWTNTSKPWFSVNLQYNIGQGTTIMSVSSNLFFQCWYEQYFPSGNVDIFFTFTNKVFFKNWITIWFFYVYLINWIVFFIQTFPVSDKGICESRKREQSELSWQQSFLENN